jgi:hypothetical protein
MNRVHPWKMNSSSACASLVSPAATQFSIAMMVERLSHCFSASRAMSARESVEKHLVVGGREAVARYGAY